ncbi:MAG: glycosyltransferase family 2 protein [Planctomycetaceae bacterium]
MGSVQMSCEKEIITEVNYSTRVEPLISVIVPTYNEDQTVYALLILVADEPTPKEILIVDDGSTDNTARQIDNWILSSGGVFRNVERVLWIRHEINQGKGFSIRSALEYVKGKYVIVQDADMELSPHVYPKLIEPLEQGDADFVIGMRITSVESNRFLYRIGIAILNIIVSLMYGYHLHDAACCFKVMQRKHLLNMNLQCQKFEFCPEVIAKASRMKLRIVEIPVPYTPRQQLDGKKLKIISDGLSAIWTLLKYRFWREIPVS